MIRSAGERREKDGGGGLSRFGEGAGPEWGRGERTGVDTVGPPRHKRSSACPPPPVLPIPLLSLPFTAAHAASV